MTYHRSYTYKDPAKVKAYYVQAIEDALLWDYSEPTEEEVCAACPCDEVYAEPDIGYSNCARAEDGSCDEYDDAVEGYRIVLSTVRKLAARMASDLYDAIGQELYNEDVSIQ